MELNFKLNSKKFKIYYINTETITNLNKRKINTFIINC